MEIRVGKIIYVYEFVPGPAKAAPPAGGARLSAAAARKRDGLANGIDNLLKDQKLNEAQAGKLKDLKQALGDTLKGLNQVPGQNLQAALLEAVAKAKQAAESGDLDGAQQQARAALETTRKAGAAGAKFHKAHTALKAQAAQLPPAGKQAVDQAMKHAQAVMTKAQTPEAMEQAAFMAQGLQKAAEKLAAAAPESAAHHEALAELGMIGAGLKHLSENLPMPEGQAEIAKDKLSLSFQKVSEAINGLKAKTRDAGQQERLGKLEERMAHLEQLAQDVPEGMKPELQQAVNAILSQAANGKVPEALTQLNAQIEKVEQAAKLSRVVDTKLALAERVAGQLQGPAKQQLESIIAKADAARQQATTPEQLMRIEALILDAVKHAQAAPTQQLGQGQQKRKLQAIEKQLEEMAPKAKPTFGDELKLASAPKAPTRPLGPARTAPLRPEPAQRDQFVRQGTAELKKADAIKAEVKTETAKADVNKAEIKKDEARHDDMVTMLDRAVEALAQLQELAKPKTVKVAPETHAEPPKAQPTEPKKDEKSEAKGLEQVVDRVILVNDPTPTAQTPQ